MQTNLVTEHSFDTEQACYMAEELMILDKSDSNLYGGFPADSLERLDHGAFERGSTYGNHNLCADPRNVHFVEFVYNVSEWESVRIPNRFGIFQ